MKITKEQLKQIIKEELDDAPKHQYLPGGEKLETSRFTDYEMDDMDTDKKMVSLLVDILAQLKTLNRHMTPAKGAVASGVEKALAQAQVAEGEGNS